MKGNGGTVGRGFIPRRPRAMFAAAGDKPLPYDADGTRAMVGAAGQSTPLYTDWAPRQTGWTG